MIQQLVLWQQHWVLFSCTLFSHWKSVGIWLFINAQKLLRIKKFCPSFFRYKRWIKTFTRLLYICMVLCCECCHDYNETLPKNSRITAKLESIWIGFLLLCFWMQTSLPNFYRSMVKTFERTDLRTTVSWQRSSFCCLKFCFRARNRFAHQTFS